MALIGFCGSRSLPPRLASRVGPVVRALLAWQVVPDGAPAPGVAVGCSVGADEMVISAVLGAAAAPSLHIFAAFGSGGDGCAPSVSASRLVLSCARVGVDIRWWAGGSPPIPLRARLACRTACLVAEVVASGPGGALVCFLASPESRGSMLACRLAAAAGLPVLVLAAFSGPPPSLGVGSGSWSRCSCCDLWSPSWRWIPAPLPSQAPLWSEIYSDDIESW